MLMSSRAGSGTPTGPTQTTKRKSQTAKPLSFKRKKKTNPFTMAAEGLKVVGPSHEDGGIEARTKDGQPVAEIEGGERIFSQEDTDYMEREARRIITLMQSNSQQANEAARALGFKVVEMIVDQEKNQRQQEGNPDQEDTEQATQAMNEFSTHPDNNQDYVEQPA